ncbi:MAG: 1-acyl-sn-glycerol-3-phosphate acyltransferase [Spirochaetes bacterium]|nr:MAG: 1-acyl-sn-glycerol-3-phosphate acyltransferase [Spirochaetota bacterium]
MNLAGKIVTGIIKWMIDSRCRIDDKELEKIPYKGPAILIFNHTNFLEVPLLYLHLRPRPVVGLAKAESWKIPLYGFLARQWGAIPIQRGTAAMSSFKKISDILKQDKMLVISPEGSRNVTGVLKKAYPGIITMAIQNNVPIIPVAHYGSENFWHNMKRFKTINFNIRVGTPFFIEPGEEKISGKVRKDLLFSIMVQLSKLLPEEYRGEYSDIASADEKYLRFLEEGTYSLESPDPVWQK